MKYLSPKISLLSDQRSQGDSIRYDSVALCYGHFNVIHPGHLRYFNQARTRGDHLIVALEGDHSLTTDERKNSFNEIERAEAIAALDLVDEVVVLNDGILIDLVQILTPALLVLGKEFERKRSIKVKGAIELMETIGGHVVYEAGEVQYAVSNISQRNQTDLERERWRQFKNSLEAQEIDLNEILGKLTKERSRLLVLGDTIVDRYVACDPVGMSKEAPLVVVKELEVRDFIGGAAIVAAHAAALGSVCHYLSVTGKDSNAVMVRDNLLEQNVRVNLFEDPSRPTTFKIRYMVDNQKLFRVSQLKEHSLEPVLEEEVIKKLRILAENVDAILVCDFVYGVITGRILDTLVEVARKNNLLLFGDLQCSSQIGNVSKFVDFNLLCPTEREARIALNNHEDGVEWIANSLMEKTRVDNLVIKLGPEGFIAYERGSDDGFLRRQHFPALTSNPLDVAGAGDAMLGAISVMLAGGHSLMEASAIGTCMAALAVQTVGNRALRPDQLEIFIEQKELRA